MGYGLCGACSGTKSVRFVDCSGDLIASHGLRLTQLGREVWDDNADKVGAADMADAIYYDKFFPAVPLVGTMIAVCFDVGYFYGVGIEYFTLFSLTEHIGFALEALPVALAIPIMATVIFAIWEQPWRLYDNRFKPASDDISEQLPFLRRKGRHLGIVQFLLLLIQAVSLSQLGTTNNFVFFC